MKRLTKDEKMRMTNGLRYALQCCANENARGLCGGLEQAAEKTIMNYPDFYYLKAWVRKMLGEYAYLENWLNDKEVHKRWLSAHCSYMFKRRFDCRRRWVEWMIKEINK